MPYEDLNEKEREIYSGITILEKIAVMTIYIGEDLTASLFSHLEVKAITDISRAIMQVKTLPLKVKVIIFEELLAIFQTSDGVAGAGLKYAREILYKSLGPAEANKILARLTKDQESAKNFAYLVNIRPSQLASFIISEHPQTISLILAHMESSYAAETLSYFGDDARADIAMRMANLGDISPQIIKRVSTVLENKLEALASYKVEVGGAKSVAEMLNRLGNQSKPILEKIEEQDQKLASTIKDMMFTFEDIIALGDKEIRELIKDIDTKDLILALKGTNEELKNKFLLNVSQRARDNLMEEMEFMGAVRLKDVEHAQRNIIDLIQKLVEDGKITIAIDEKMVE